MSSVLLVDLSSILHQEFHVSGNNPNPDATALATIARVHGLANGSPHVGICLDSPPYFRKDIDPTYKANRDKDNNAVIAHQMAIAVDVLRKDYAILSAKGYEADDVIATATRSVLADSGKGGSLTVDGITIASADKDLLQLVTDTVTVISTVTGNRIGSDEVKAKYGVWPHQMVDYLSLVGDASDNIKGAAGIGAKRAAEMLELFGNLDDAVKANAESLDNADPKTLSATSRSLLEFEPRMATVRDLIRLRTDAPIPFDEIFKERQPMESSDDEREAPEKAQSESAQAVPEGVSRDGAENAGHQGSSLVPSVPKMDRAAPMVVRVPEVIDHAPVAFGLQLEPRSMREAKDLAADLFASRLFGAYGNAPAVLSTLIAGRELGFQTMASLRAFHIIDGKPTLAAGAIHSLILSSGKAKYFRCTERTATKATFETQRGDDPPMPLTFTIKEARQAWAKDEKAWNNSGWGKNPADMLVARALTKLARLVYPDVCNGLYSPEEF